MGIMGYTSDNSRHLQSILHPQSTYAQRSITGAINTAISAPLIVNHSECPAQGIHGQRCLSDSVYITAQLLQGANRSYTVSTCHGATDVLRAVRIDARLT